MSNIKIKINKSTGEVEAYKNGKLIGNILTTSDYIGEEENEEDDEK